MIKGSPLVESQLDNYCRLALIVVLGSRELWVVAKLKVMDKIVEL